jgi:hypothetical protein
VNEKLSPNEQYSSQAHNRSILGLRSANTFQSCINRREKLNVTSKIILMTSIEFNFNIMSLLGNTDQEASVSSQGEEEGNEQHLHSQQSTLVQNDSITDSVVGSDTASTTTAFVRRTIGVSDDATRTAESARRIRDSSSGTSLGSRYDLENRGFSSTEAAHPSSSSALLNDGSFEIENYENLTEDLGLNPLIDVNEPTPQVPPPKNLEDNNQGTVSAIIPATILATIPATIPNCYEKEYILSFYAHGVCAPQTHDEDMDKKPAAVDSTIFQQQQQRSSSIQNALSFDQTITGEKGGEGRKITPVASVVRGSDRSSEQEGKSDLKPPPVPSLTRGNRRSSRIHTQKKAVPKRARPSVGKFSRARPTIGTESNMKTSASKKRKSTKVAGPSKKQLKEARTPRKIEALQTWFKRLQELVDFKDANGHGKKFVFILAMRVLFVYPCSPLIRFAFLRFLKSSTTANVPQQYTKNHSLGIWVNKQRMEKKAKDTGKPSSLTDEKVQLLEEAGFVWAKRKGQVAWEEKFVELQTFLLRNGHCK